MTTASSSLSRTTTASSESDCGVSSSRASGPGKASLSLSIPLGACARSVLQPLLGGLPECGESAAGDSGATSTRGRRAELSAKYRTIMVDRGQSEGAKMRTDSVVREVRGGRAYRFSVDEAEV